MGRMELVPALLNLFRAVSLLLELMSPCYIKGSVSRYGQRDQGTNQGYCLQSSAGELIHNSI